MWTDPPHYFEKVVYPEYLKNNTLILQSLDDLGSSENNHLCESPHISPFIVISTDPLISTYTDIVSRILLAIIKKL